MLIRCQEQLVRGLTAPVPGKGSSIFYRCWGPWGLPLCDSCLPCVATPSAHAYHPLCSHPQKIRPCPNVNEGKMQENPLINLNRGSLISPPKAFPPLSPRGRAEGQ